MDVFGRYFIPAVIASGTALIIAFKAYPWQKAKDRELEIAKERRRAVSRLVSALEALTVKIIASNTASKKTVPFFTNDFAEVKASIGEAKIHGLDGFSRKAEEFREHLRMLRQAILRAKRVDPSNHPKPINSPARYRAARQDVLDKFNEMQLCRNEFFDEAKSALKIERLEPAPMDKKLLEADKDVEEQ